jgi:hypothetical protein
MVMSSPTTVTSCRALHFSGPASLNITHGSISTGPRSIARVVGGASATAESCPEARQFAFGGFEKGRAGFGVFSKLEGLASCSSFRGVDKRRRSELRCCLLPALEAGTQKRGSFQGGYGPPWTGSRLGGAATSRVAFTVTRRRCEKQCEAIVRAEGPVSGGNSKTPEPQTLNSQTAKSLEEASGAPEAVEANSKPRRTVQSLSERISNLASLPSRPASESGGGKASNSKSKSVSDLNGERNGVVASESKSKSVLELDSTSDGERIVKSGSEAKTKRRTTRQTHEGAQNGREQELAVDSSLMQRATPMRRAREKKGEKLGSATKEATPEAGLRAKELVLGESSGQVGLPAASGVDADSRVKGQESLQRALKSKPLRRASMSGSEGKGLSGTRDAKAESGLASSGSRKNGLERGLAENTSPGEADRAADVAENGLEGNGLAGRRGVVDRNPEVRERLQQMRIKYLKNVQSGVSGQNRDSNQNGVSDQNRVRVPSPVGGKSEGGPNCGLPVDVKGKGAALLELMRRNRENAKREADERKNARERLDASERLAAEERLARAETTSREEKKSKGKKVPGGQLLQSEDADVVDVAGGPRLGPMEQRFKGREGRQKAESRVPEERVARQKEGVSQTEKRVRTPTSSAEKSTGTSGEAPSIGGPGVLIQEAEDRGASSGQTRRKPEGAVGPSSKGGSRGSGFEREGESKRRGESREQFAKEGASGLLESHSKGGSPRVPRSEPERRPEPELERTGGGSGQSVVRSEGGASSTALKPRSKVAGSEIGGVGERRGGQAAVRSSEGGALGASKTTPPGARNSPMLMVGQKGESEGSEESALEKARRLFGRSKEEGSASIKGGLPERSAQGSSSVNGGLRGRPAGNDGESVEALKRGSGGRLDRAVNSVKGGLREGVSGAVRELEKNPDRVVAPRRKAPEQQRLRGSVNRPAAEREEVEDREDEGEFTLDDQEEEEEEEGVQELTAEELAEERAERAQFTPEELEAGEEVKYAGLTIDLGEEADDALVNQFLERGEESGEGVEGSEGMGEVRGERGSEEEGVRREGLGDEGLEGLEEVIRERGSEGEGSGKEGSGVRFGAESEDQGRGVLGGSPEGGWSEDETKGDANGGGRGAQKLPLGQGVAESGQGLAGLEGVSLEDLTPLERARILFRGGRPSLAEGKESNPPAEEKPPAQVAALPGTRMTSPGKRVTSSGARKKVWRRGEKAEPEEERVKTREQLIEEIKQMARDTLRDFLQMRLLDRLRVDFIVNHCPKFLARHVLLPLSRSRDRQTPPGVQMQRLVAGLSGTQLLTAYEEALGIDENERETARRVLAQHLHVHRYLDRGVAEKIASSCPIFLVEGVIIPASTIPIEALSPVQVRVAPFGSYFIQAMLLASRQGLSRKAGASVSLQWFRNKVVLFSGQVSKRNWFRKVGVL